jgi:hypothetical protein
MITHSIIVEEPYKYVAPYVNNGPPVYTLEYKHKLGYAAYIGRLIYRKGDYVCKVNATYPYKAENYWRVKDIQEVHHLVSYHHQTGLPFCINLVNAKGDDIWVTANEIFRSSNPPPGTQFKVEGLDDHAPNH